MVCVVVNMRRYTLFCWLESKKCLALWFCFFVMFAGFVLLSVLSFSWLVAIDLIVLVVVHSIPEEP